MLLSDASKKNIDSWVAKFPEGKQRSALIMALRIAQDEHGHLTEPLMQEVADYLSLPKAYVYEVATFYTMYRLEPHGKYTIGICDSISCMLCGAKQLTTYTEKKLGIKVGETTKDGMFTLKHVECLAACCAAPAVLVNDNLYHENMSPDKIDSLIDYLRGDS
jgi:NADH-quinone oxidoreductase subunit E